MDPFYVTANRSLQLISSNNQQFLTRNTPPGARTDTVTVYHLASTKRGKKLQTDAN